MRSYSSPMVIIVVLGLVSVLCGQEATPAPAGNQGATASQPPSQSKTDSSPAASSPAATVSSSAIAGVPFGEINGVVKSGNIPLPGVTVNAANTLTGKKYSTSTDIDGTFKIS